MKQIGQIKTEDQSVFYVPSREREVFKDLIQANQGPLNTDSLKAIYREIMSAALSLEHMLKIAYLGSEGAYTHKAAVSKFGMSVQYQAMSSIKDIFEAVARKRCDYGVVPIENSTEGAVTYTLDMFIDYDLKICSEISLEINHLLMAKTAEQPITKIYSNPQVFGQCRQWLHAHYPNITLVNTDSTTSAAQMAASDPGSAAIASELAAELYGLKVIEENIQDTAHNMTRFLIIGQESCRPSDADKTSIVLSMDNEVGVLSKALEPFKKNQINMTKIESRPAKTEPWRYYFFIDFEGHVEHPGVSKAMGQLRKICTYFKILGSYPKEVR